MITAATRTPKATDTTTIITANTRTPHITTTRTLQAIQASTTVYTAYTLSTKSKAIQASTTVYTAYTLSYQFTTTRTPQTTRHTTTTQLLKVPVLQTCHPLIQLETTANGMMLDLDNTAPEIGILATSLLLNNAAHVVEVKWKNVFLT